MAKKYLILAVASIAFAFGVVFFSPNETQAAVGSGGSGSPSSSCNGGGINDCPWTSNGGGWLQIAVDDTSNAPRGNVSRWNAANTACKRDGARYVMVYALYTGQGTRATAWIWNYKDASHSQSGNAFPNNISGRVAIGTVESRWGNVPRDDKAGYDFGDNVGWFCHGIQWSISASNSRVHASGTKNVGDLLEYTYRVDQDGPGDTTKTVYYRNEIKRMPASFGSGTRPTTAQVRTNGVVVSNESGTVKRHPASGQGSIASGWESGERLLVRNTQTSLLQYNTRSLDASRWVCTYTYAYPRNQDSTTARVEDSKCDFVRDPSWALSKETRSAVNPANPNTANFGSTYTSTAKTANVGDKVYFLSQVTKDSNTASASFDRQRQRLIKYPDGRVITDCNSVRAGYTWTTEGGYNGCIWTGATGTSNWSATTTQAFYTSSENDRSFFGSGTVPARLGGMRICERYGTDPRGSDSGRGWHYGGWNCVNINAAPYTLTPTVNLDRDTASPGETVTANGVVNNGSTITSRDAEWQIRRIIVTPGGSIPTAAQGSTQTPVQYFGSGAQLIAQGNQPFPRSNTSVWTGSEEVGDLEVGSSICYTLSVRPDNATGDTWSHGISCVIIAKKPKIQVLGGDLLVGRSVGSNPGRTSEVNTSITNKTGTYYGSWAEYGIIANGCVQGMSSGAGLAGGFAGNATTPPAMTNTDISRLTFTNPAQRAASGPSCAVGNYTHAKAAPNVEARFTITRAASAATPGNPADPAVLPGSPSSQNLNVNLDNGASPRLNGEYQLPVNVRTLTISGGTVGSASGANRGRSVIINAPTATVRITGDIRYTQDRLTAIGDIPQVVIIAHNILIAEDVTQVDAWLVAVGTDEGATQNGVVNTCAVGSNYLTNNNLTSNMCSDALTINGPVIANHVHLRRTAGSGLGPDSGDPAEVFNLRADAYIWSVRYNQNGGRLSTMSTVELPPRF